MFAKLVVSVVVLGGSGVAYFGSARSAPAAAADCCALGLLCCEVQAPCCKPAAVPDCCYPGSPCCTGGDCCLVSK